MAALTAGADPTVTPALSRTDTFIFPWNNGWLLLPLCVLHETEQATGVLLTWQTKAGLSADQ